MKMKSIKTFKSEKELMNFWYGKRENRESSLLTTTSPIHINPLIEKLLGSWNDNCELINQITELKLLNNFRNVKD